MWSAAMLLLLVLTLIVSSAADNERTQLLEWCRVNYPPNGCSFPGMWYRMDAKRCIKVARTYATFDTSEMFCVRDGGHLVSISSLTEFNQVLCLLVRDMYNRNEYWIGARRSQGKFSWVDGSGPLTYTRWASGQPSNQQQQDCVVMNYGSWGPWNNLACSENRLFVCEKRG